MVAHNGTNGHAAPPANGAGELSRCPSGRRSRPCVFIGVAGGTASGKTTVCSSIMERLHDSCVALVHQDSFYRSLTQQQLLDVKNHNFDHPDAFDMEAMMQCLSDLKEGRSVEVPTYDFTRHQRSDITRKVDPADVVIVEGILALHFEQLRELLHMKIYVDTDDDVRLARRIQRDVALRGRDVAGVLDQYTKFVKPAFDQFVAPSRRHADVIIPWHSHHNLVAIDLITEHIRTKLQQHALRRIYPNLEVIPSNYQIRGMHTIIRDRNCSSNDFVFFADRLNRLVVEAGLGLLPFSERTVVTPTGERYVGVDFCKKLCGVSIIRSGESMEAALRTCCKGIKIGKILVVRHHGVRDSGRRRSSSQGERAPSACSDTSNEDAAGTRSLTPDHQLQQQIIYEKLPADIAHRHVLLMDPILSTGNTAVRAVEVLLSKGVPEDKIFFLSIIAAPEGIHHVCKAFPKLRVITSEVDDGVDDTYAVVPGIGEFGDRYFTE